MSLSIATISLLAFAVAPQAADKPAQPADKLVRGPDVFCEARTLSGGTLGLRLVQLYPSGAETVAIFARDEKSWPVKGTSAGLLGVRNEVKEELQYIIGNDLEFRMSKAGSIRALVIWKMKNGKVRLPVAYGYCSLENVKSETALAAGDIDPFDQSRWQQKCFITVPPPSEIRATISWKYSEQGTQTRMEFASDNKALFPANAVAFGALTKAAALVENREILVGRSEFAPMDGAVGPKGEMIGITDSNDGASVILLRFASLNGTNIPGFGICSAQAKPDARTEK